MTGDRITADAAPPEMSPPGEPVSLGAQPRVDALIAALRRARAAGCERVAIAVAIRPEALCAYGERAADAFMLERRYAARVVEASTDHAVYIDPNDPGRFVLVGHHLDVEDTWSTPQPTGARP